jgi:PAS domain S-box-containing protein
MRPLGYRLFAYVVLFGTVLALLTTAVQMLFGYRAQLRVIDDRMDQIERSYRPIFAGSLWTFDESQINIALQGIAALPDIVYAEIEAAGGQHYASGAAPTVKTIARSFPLVYVGPGGEKAPLGTLRVHATLDDVYRRLRASLFEELATNAIKIFLTAAFILFLFRRLVTRHLSAMADYTRHLGLSTLSQPLTLLRRTRRPSAAGDEIDQVAAAINNMRQSLQREQQALRASDERFATVFHLSPLGIGIVRLADGHFVDVNEAYCRTTGYTREELVGHSTTEFRLWDSPPERAAIMRLMQPQAVTEIFKFNGRKKSGETHIGLAAMNRITLNGEAHVVSLIQDITELEHTQEALRWRTALLEAQINSDLDGILVVDKQGKKLIQNQRMNELWKIPAEVADDPDDSRQVRYVTNRTKNPQQFTEKVAALYAQTNEISRDEIELVDGTVLDRYTAPVRDTQGNYYGRVWTFRDITARKQLEEQYRQAQKMDAFGQMAGGVAHDFNNILTAVLVQLNLMQTEPDLRESTRASLLELNGYVQRGASLTRQLLMFSRRQAMHVQTLDLNHVIEGLVKMLRRILSENIKLEFPDASVPVWIAADAGMIEQVAMNLCVNARDAMPDGGRLVLRTGIVTLDARSVRSGAAVGRYAFLSVTDTGIGMDEATTKRIFEPFFTTKPVGKGTGLGLATAYGIVNQHRGWIEVESAVGQGSTFRVFIPAAREAPRKDERPAVPEIKGGTETILLVEDDPGIRPVAAKFLRKYGYRVIEATNGVEALQQWEKEKSQVSLLLTDMVMPEGMTGLQLATRLRKAKGSLKIIISSGYNNEMTDEDDPLLKGTVYLAKPFEPYQLLKAVRQCLDAGA